MNEVTEKKSRGIDISDISQAISVSVVHTSVSYMTEVKPYSFLSVKVVM